MRAHRAAVLGRDGNRPQTPTHFLTIIAAESPAAAVTPPTALYRRVLRRRGGAASAMSAQAEGVHSSEAQPAMARLSRWRLVTASRVTTPSTRPPMVKTHMPSGQVVYPAPSSN